MAREHEITAIPTVYSGVQLKSRMESKVALLLDKLGWKWEYEPFSVMLDGINYTPDFYIPEHGYVIECRGYDDEKGRKQLNRFTRAYPSLEIPNRPIEAYLVIGPQEALFYDRTGSAHELVVEMCDTCGIWFASYFPRGPHTCLCVNEDDRINYSVMWPLHVERGEIFVGCHKPDAWAALKWEKTEVWRQNLKTDADDMADFIERLANHVRQGVVVPNSNGDTRHDYHGLALELVLSHKPYNIDLFAEFVRALGWSIPIQIRVDPGGRC